MGQDMVRVASHSTNQTHLNSQPCQPSAKISKKENKKEKKEKTFCWSRMTVETSSLSPTMYLSHLSSSTRLIFFLFFLLRHTYK
jgi:hypothetical protein